MRFAFEEIGLEEALAVQDGAGRPTNAAILTILIFLPTGAQTSFDIQKQVEAWMGSRPGEHGAPYEVPYRSDRILWRRARAACFGIDEFYDDIRRALAYFSLCERELALLEDRITAGWSGVHEDIPLMHSVTRRELGRQPIVDLRTREAHDMRVAFFRLDTALERLDRVLSAPAQRIVLELAQQADTIDRLRLLDDAIEIAQEVYDTANDRLLEYRYFRSEVIMEIIIAILLLAEFVVVVLDILEK